MLLTAQFSCNQKVARVQNLKNLITRIASIHSYNARAAAAGKTRRYHCSQCMLGFYFQWIPVPKVSNALPLRFVIKSTTLRKEVRWSAFNLSYSEVFRIWRKQWSNQYSYNSVVSEALLFLFMILMTILGSVVGATEVFSVKLLVELAREF